MVSKCIGIGAAAAVSLSMLCGKAESGVVLGYITGNDYLRMKVETRQFWLLGAIDGIMAEDLHRQIGSEKPARAPWLGDCIEDLGFMQIRAIFEKELKAKPEAWHAPAAQILRGRLHKFCAGR